MRRIATATGILIALVIAACSTTGSTQNAVRPVGDFNVHSILPPGEPPADKALPTQATLYDRLNEVPPNQITDATVGQYFKQAPLDPAPEDVARTENPPQRPDVKIVWDRWGVPYVYGKTNADVAWGAGWAGVETRMFAMDYIRYSGAARSAELVPIGDPVTQDKRVLPLAAYSPEEAQAQVDALAASGPEGQEAVSRIDAFVDGINASRQQLCPTVTAPNCPKEYALFKIKLKPYTPADIVYAASVIGAIYGGGGGQEALNADWLAQLRKKFAAGQADKIFNDTLQPLDPEAQVTVPGQYPYGPSQPVDPAAVAVPDLNATTAPGTAGKGPDKPEAYQEAVATNQGTLYKLPLAPLAASNALVVSGSRSATGHPIAVFGPQTGYQSPNLLQEVALHGPGYDVRGAAFANLQLFVLMGHGPGYAWSATSAFGDVVDTVAETLCGPNGKAVTVNSTSYVDDKGNCVPLEVRSHTEKPLLGAPVSLPVMKTRHGVVQYRTTVGGKPVAIVRQRSTYGDEISPTLGFMRMNDPTQITGQQAFKDAFAKVGFTFNWFYVDDTDVAEFTSGKLPLRAPGQDWALPRWGAAKWDWQGWLDASAHPQTVNPDQGWLASWNNKPAIGERAPDNVDGWGRLQRVLPLETGIQAKLADGHKTDTAGVLSVIMNGATVDPLAAYLMPEILDVLGKDPQTDKYTNLLRSWARTGAHRVDRARTGAYTDQAAIALWDAWWPVAAVSVAHSRLGDLAFHLLNDPRHELPSEQASATGGHQGEAYTNNIWYVLLDKDLRRMLGQDVRGPLSQAYCGEGKLAACRAVLKQSLLTAVNQLETQQKQADPTKWVYPKSADEIKFLQIGIQPAPPPTDWQNRPAFEQVVTTAQLPQTTPSVPPK